MNLLLALALAAAARSEDVIGAATLSAARPDSKAAGTARIEEEGGELSLSLSLSGLAPGKHGLHIREFGSCADAGRAAGGHFDPDGRAHGDALKAPRKSHAGDLGNIEADANGNAYVQLRVKRLKLLRGKRAIAGRALAVTEKADDLTQPLGNAGAIVACGPVLVAGSLTVNIPN